MLCASSSRLVGALDGMPTCDDLTVVNGKQDQLLGRVQERYGIAEDEAERQVKEWTDRARRNVRSPGKIVGHLEGSRERRARRTERPGPFLNDT